MNLGDTLKRSPAYLFDFVVGFIVICLSDVLVTSLLLGSVAIGFVLGPFAGAAVFFLIYALIKAVNSLSLAITQGALAIARTLPYPPEQT